MQLFYEFITFKIDYINLYFYKFLTFAVLI